MAEIKAKIPLGRIATPEEIASAAAFLAAGGDLTEAGQGLASQNARL